MIGTLESADEFHAARGNEDWAAAPEDKRMQALQRATDYIEAHYLPRLSELTPDTVVERAVYLIARIELETPNFFAVTRHPERQNKVLVGVGDIRWQVVDGGAADGYYPVHTLVDDMLKAYFMSSWPGLGIMVV